MAHTLHILDSTGDTTLTWEPGTASADEVKARFDEMVKVNGMLAYTVSTDERTGEPVSETTREFVETAPRIVVQPQIVGG